MKVVMDRIELFLIGANYKRKQVMQSFINDEEGAETVEVVIGIAIFAAVALGIAMKLGGAITSKGDDAANIIESAAFK